MPSSGEIAQMFASQQAAFASQNVFASQIGINGPGMGLGAYGGGGSFAGRFQQAPGGAPPVWSYAPTGMLGPGYGAGNQFAGGVMSGFGGAATIGGVGLGLAAGFGKLGPMGHLFDPFGAAMGGFRAAGGMAGGMGAFGAGALAAMPAIGLGMAASHMVGSFVHGGQQQAGIAREMGQFNFFNPMSRTGSGFTRDDAQMIGSRIRELAHIPEMMTSVEELTRLLPNLRKAGTFQGIKEIGEFQTRFNDSIKTIKTMSKMLGTTMEQASEFFAHSTSVGFLGKQAQLQNVLNAQFTSGVTGMNMGQVMGMQQQGAMMGVQLGVGRRLGAQAVTSNAQRLGAAQMAGVIGEGDLEDITGLQGPEAVQAASQRLTQAAIGMTQNSAAGRLAMIGLAKFDSSGKAIGIDEDLVNAFRDGKLSISELKTRVSRLSDTQKISATARAGSLGALTAAHAGPEVLGRILQQAMADRFGGDSAKADEALNMLMQRNGLTEREADVFKKVMGQSATGMEDMARIKQREALIAEKYSPGAYWQKFKVALRNVTTAPFEEAGASVYNALGKEYDKFFDDVVGRHMVTMSKEGAEGFAKALAGNSSEFRRELGRLHGINLDTKELGRTRYSKAGAYNALLQVGTLGIINLVEPNLREKIEASLDEQEFGEERRSYAGRQAGRAAGLGSGDVDRLSRLAKLGSSGGAGGRLDRLRRYNSDTGRAALSTEDMSDRAKVMGALTDDLQSELESGVIGKVAEGKRGDLRAALARGDYAAVQALTGLSQNQMMAGQGGSVLQQYAVMRAKADKAGGGAGEAFAGVGVAGAVAAGTVGSMGGNLKGMLKDDLFTVGGKPADPTNIKDLQAAQEETKKNIRGRFGDTSALATSRKARQVALDLLDPEKGKENADLRRDITGAKNISTVKQLIAQKYGITLTDEEAEGVKAAAGGGAAERDILGKAELAEMRGDDKVIKDRAIEASGAFSDSVRAAKFAAGSKEEASATAIQEALKGLGSFEGEADKEAKSGVMREALGGAISHARALLKSGNKKAYQKFIAGLGAFGRTVSQGAESESKLSGQNNVSFDKLAASLGITDEAGKAKLREVVDSNADTKGLNAFNFEGEEGGKKLHAIEQSVAGMRASGVITRGGGTVSTKDKDQEIISTLKQMQETSKLQTTMLIVANKDKFAEGSYAAALASSGAKTNDKGQVVFTKPEEK